MIKLLIPSLPCYKRVQESGDEHGVEGDADVSAGALAGGVEGQGR